MSDIEQVNDLIGMGFIDILSLIYVYLTRHNILYFRVYGFYDECKRKYSTRLWKRFVDVFNCLPAGK